MRSLFPGYYQPSEDEFAEIWQKCTFILDANVLLNLYRYPAQARDELVHIFTKVQSRLWIPFQVALEYQRNRPSVIAEQKGKFQEVRRIAGDVVPTLEDTLNKLRLRDRHSVINPDHMIADINTAVSNFLTELDTLENSQASVSDVDKLRESLDELLTGKVGEAPTQDCIIAIYKEGVQRFESDMPPGFMDKKKGDSSKGIYTYGGVTYQAKFGDLILWKQIIKFASSLQSPSIIFITDDEKPDWWWSVESQGKKKLGPRPELVDEIRREGKVAAFYMYNSAQFLKYAKAYIQADVSAESIEQIREVSAQAAGAAKDISYGLTGEISERVLDYVSRGSLFYKPYLRPIQVEHELKERVAAYLSESFPTMKVSTDVSLDGSGGLRGAIADITVEGPTETVIVEVNFLSDRRGATADAARHAANFLALPRVGGVVALLYGSSGGYEITAVDTPWRQGRLLVVAPGS